MKLIIISKRTIYVFAIILILMILMLFLISSRSEIPANTLPVSNKVIVIDPGHGGVDPGALTSDGITEKEIVLSIAFKLKRLLEQTGTIVILTREEDVGLYKEGPSSYNQKKNEDLRARRIMINDINPDMFISIHLNSFPQSRYYGAQTFYHKGSEEGKKLAKLVQKELRDVLDNGNNRTAHSRSSIYLLKEVEATSVLIECGFLSNPTEAKLLEKSKYQEKIAWSIYSGIIKYFNEIDK